VSAGPAGAWLSRLVPERNGATSMPKRTRKCTGVVIGGVDTHGRTHHAAVIDQRGRLLGDQELPADNKGSGGYRLLLSWLSHQPLGASKE
jgi:hypothetical protein